MKALRLLPIVLLAAAAADAAEIWSSGRTALRIGGEFTGTAGPVDRGYFNDTDYGQSLLRQARLSLSVELAAGERFGLLAEARVENMDHPRLYALYVRARPWAGRPFDLQAGLIPPVFGRFARAGYGADNPLIGDPLAYQYLTTLRANTLPPGAADLLRMRGNGWRVGYSGYQTAESGLPMVAGRRWDTGVEARVGGESFQVAAAFTQGTLSEPRVRDDNDGKQISARAGTRCCAAKRCGRPGTRPPPPSRSWARRSRRWPGTSRANTWSSPASTWPRATTACTSGTCRGRTGRSPGKLPSGASRRASALR